VTSDPVEKGPPVQPTPPDEQVVQSVTTPPEEPERPGMGPMIKKKLGGTENAASKFRAAAAAAGAFKPRAGGAAAKLFAPKETKSDEPDGISGVFKPQRPKEAPKEAPKEDFKQPEEPPKPIPDRLSKERPRISTEVVPSVTISSPLSPAQAAPLPDTEEKALTPSLDQAVVQKSVEPEVRRKKRRSNQQIMNLSNLGVDPGLIDEQGLEFEGLLTELGWGSNELSAKHIDALENDIKREIARVEAGSWLNHLEQKDDRVEAVERMLDRAIAECDELEGLLTLYNVELGVS
jgi:hypothetical protein